MAQNLFTMACKPTREGLSAAIFWLKVWANWSEYAPPRPKAEEPLGKKEAAERDALTAGDGTEWASWSIDVAAWSLAVPDWRERIRTGRSLLPDLPHLDQTRRAVAIFNKLRLPDVVGTPALAEAGADWFREIVGVLHGSFDPATRERMIREVFLLAPKKSRRTPRR